MKNPKGIKIGRFVKKSSSNTGEVDLGVAEFTFPLAAEAALGKYELDVSYKYGAGVTWLDTAVVEVREYVLPKFSIKTEFSKPYLSDEQVVVEQAYVGSILTASNVDW